MKKIIYSFALLSVLVINADAAAYLGGGYSIGGGESKVKGEIFDFDDVSNFNIFVGYINPDNNRFEFRYDSTDIKIGGNDEDISYFGVHYIQTFNLQSIISPYIDGGFGICKKNNESGSNYSLGTGILLSINPLLELGGGYEHSWSSVGNSDITISNFKLNIKIKF